jgi:hypothetical protein
MGRKKGTEKTGGRKAGTPNKITGTVKEWIQKVIDGKRQQFEDDLDDLEPGERVRVISNLLQYVTPKMQSASAEELMEAEYKKLEELLDIAPEEAINEIVERVNRLTNDSRRKTTKN